MHFPQPPPPSSLILAINTGSSSVRLALFGVDPAGMVAGMARVRHARTDEDPGGLLQDFVRQHDIISPVAVVHRVVHGGARRVNSCLLDKEAEDEIERLAPLAPLHNPYALRWLRAARALWGPGVSQIGVFDTAFYAPLPEVARTYGIPRTLTSRLSLRRYGFHGLAHRSMWQAWRQVQAPPVSADRVISLQLGAGCSVTAVEEGVPQDTSMGFSPLEGLLMATRSGDIDPGLVLYLQRHEGWSLAHIEAVLGEQSGLLGVSELSADLGTLLDSNEPGARLAVDLYCYRARKYIGAYLAVLGPPRAILFGGGVGENLPEIRRRILDGFAWCGLQLDDDANQAADLSRRCVSAPDSRIQVWVIPVDEEVVLAQEAVDILSHRDGR